MLSVDVTTKVIEIPKVETGEPFTLKLPIGYQIISVDKQDRTLLVEFPEPVDGEPVPEVEVSFVVNSSKGGDKYQRPENTKTKKIGKLEEGSFCQFKEKKSVA